LEVEVLHDRVIDRREFGVLMADGLARIDQQDRWPAERLGVLMENMADAEAFPAVAWWRRPQEDPEGA